MSRVYSAMQIYKAIEDASARNGYRPCQAGFILSSANPLPGGVFSYPGDPSQPQVNVCVDEATFQSGYTLAQHPAVFAAVSANALADSMAHGAPAVAQPSPFATAIGSMETFSLFGLSTPMTYALLAGGLLFLVSMGHKR